MPYLVLDLEMTGPEPDYNEIIQIGAVLFDDNWVEKGQYLTNVYPENKEGFSSSSEKIHNLSLADLEDAPDGLAQAQAAAVVAQPFVPVHNSRQILAITLSVPRRAATLEASH